MVEGVDALTRKLTVVIPAKVEAATRAAMEKGADELVAMMKRLAPVDSGDLRDSIAWTWGAAPRNSIVLAKSSPDGKGMRIVVYAGDDFAFYARMVEFGTVKSAAQPFFFPSYRAMKKRIKSRVNRAMRKAIREGSEA